MLWGLLSLPIAGCDRDSGGPAFETIRSWSLPDGLAAIDLSPDAQAVALGSSRGESSMWIAPWKLSVVFDGLDQPLLAANFDDRAHLNFARADGSVEARADSGAVLLEAKLGEGAARARAAFSPGGRFVALGASVYELRGRRLVAQAEAGSAHSAVAFASERFVLIGGPGPELTAFALAGGPERRFRVAGAVSAAAISRDGRLVAAGTQNGVAVWGNDPAEPSCRYTSGPVVALRFSRSGRWLAVAGTNELTVLGGEDCALRARLRLPDPVTALDVDADLIALGDARGRALVWDVFNARWLARAQVFDAPVLAIRIHAATRSLLVAANRGEGAEAQLLRALGR